MLLQVTDSVVCVYDVEQTETVSTQLRNALSTTSKLFNVVLLAIDNESEKIQLTHEDTFLHCKQ